MRALQRSIVEGERSAVAVIGAYLERIEALDPAIGAFLCVDAAGALEQAAAVDAKRAAGIPLGPLAGIPVGLKDALCTRGLPTTCGSRMLEGYRPPFDATVVQRLRAADAVVVGKLSMDEFAMGSSNEACAFGPVHNPWDLDRVPGGSSGGSAAAVAAGLCSVALGTDTGGSIRQPAGHCGVVGLKPTYGRISRFGVVAFASSLDQVGVLGRRVRDVARVMEIIAGPDPLDSTCSARAVPALEAPHAAELHGVRVGIPREYFPAEGLGAEVEAAVRGAIDRLVELGAEPVAISLPTTRHAVACYYLIATAEASSNLARFDGVRYGRRAAARDLRQMYERSRAELGLEVKRRVLLGTFALSAGYRDAYYRKASQVRTLVGRDFERAFESVDVIAGPTSPSTAFRLGARARDPIAMYLGDVFTVGASLAGLPGISVPCGFDSGGLPIGLQLLGRPFQEATLVRVAAAYEDAGDWRGGRAWPGGAA